MTEALEEEQATTPIMTILTNVSRLPSGIQQGERRERKWVDGRDSNCQPTGCGNVISDEQCDDGNIIHRRATNLCRTAICGDRVVQTLRMR